MNVTICSRKEIEKLLSGDFPQNTAVISFYNPQDKRSFALPPIDYSGKADRVFHIALHDIDIETLEDFDLTFDTYFPEAPELANFIHTAHSDGLDIICQCEYGQSRSAACAAAIKEYFDHSGITIFADYRYYPNQLVFNKLLEALKKIWSVL